MIGVKSGVKRRVDTILLHYHVVRKHESKAVNRFEHCLTPKQ